MNRILTVFCAVFIVASGAFAQTSNSALMERFKAYRYGGNRAVLDEVAAWASESRKDPERRKEAASSLAEILYSDAPFEVKQSACRNLVLLATQLQFAALVKLLDDPQLSHYALLAMANIPGDNVDGILRARLSQSSGRTLMELLDILGERKCSAAIPEMARYLKSTDSALFEAAAFALAKTGNWLASEPLILAYKRDSGTQGRVAGHALLEIGNRILRAGDRARAYPVFDVLDRTSPDLPTAAAALRGVVQCMGVQAMPALLAALGEDGTLRQSMAACLAREMPGKDITANLCRRLPQLTPRGQVMLITALSERGDPSAAPAIISLRKSPDPAVRAAALGALGDLGGASAVSPLLEEAAGAQKETKQAARDSLTHLRGPEVDRILLAALSDSRPGIGVEAIGAISRRGTPGAASALLASSKSPSRQISSAALRALRESGGFDILPELVTLLLAKLPSERDEVISTVSEIARRGQTEEQRTGVILRRLAHATDTPDRIDLLTIASEVGGPKALGAIRGAFADTEPAVQMSALRLLAEWPTDEPMEDLLKLVRASGDQRQRAIALRGYVHMISLNESRSPDQAITLYRGVSAFTKSSDEKRLVLSGLTKVRSLAALEYASSYLADESVRGEAELAVAVIGRAVAGAYPDRVQQALQPIAQNSSSETARSKAREAIALIGRFGDYVTAWEVSPGYQQTGVDYSCLFDIPFLPEYPARQRQVPWRIMPAGTNPEQPWLLDLLAAIGGEQKVAYLRTAMWSESERDLVLEAGSDDGLKVWWNGSVVLSRNVARAVAPGQEKVTVRAKQGWNQMLFKVTQNVMGWGACARIINPDGSRTNGIRFAPSPAP
jgi:HEAT repeat protein